MRRIVWLAAVVVVVCAFGAWFYFAPYLAVRNMRLAAENRDTNTLSSYVDYPALRESLKANLTAMMVSETAKNGEAGSSPFAALGTAIAVNFANTLIDNLVTPEGVERMVAGNSPDLSKSNAAGTPSLSGAAGKQESDVGLVYQSFDEFMITFKDQNNANNSPVLIMRRENLFSWKLAALRMPNSPASTQSSSASTTPAVSAAQAAQTSAPKADEPVPISLTLVKKGFKAASPQNDDFEDDITLEFSVANISGKDIRAFDGTVVFTDLLDNRILAISLAINDPVKAGSSMDWLGGIKYNQFEDSHQRLRSERQENLKVTFVPKKVLFADGMTKEYQQP